jgi:hypothetical protein
MPQGGGSGGAPSGDGGAAMLGDRLGEPARQSTGTRALPIDRQQVPPEVWHQGQGTLPGQPIADLWTARQTARPGSVPQGAARVVMLPPSGALARRATAATAIEHDAEGGGRDRWQPWESTGARRGAAPGRSTAGAPAGRRAPVEGTPRRKGTRDSAPGRS